MPGSGCPQTRRRGHPTDPAVPLVGTASRFGAVLSEGQSFVSARLTQVAPVKLDLGTGTLISLETSGGPRTKAVAIFHPADVGGGFAPGSYRIDGVVQTATGRVNLSWDLPALARTTSTESLLLAADRAWPSVPRAGWTVLAPDHHTRVTPALSGNLLADVGVAPWYLGVAHPGANFESVVVWQLSDATFPTRLSTQVSQLVPGFAAVRPIAGDWLPGQYAIVITSQAKSQGITICVR